MLTKGFYAVESDTNFIFARHPKIGGADLYQAVKNDGILIRHFNTPGIEDFVRITVGTQKQMELLKESFNKITGGLK